MKKLHRTIMVAAAAAFVALIIAPNAAQARGNDDVAAVKFITQNLYVGANLFQILDAAPDEIPAATAQIFSDIQRTDFFQRAESLADMIARRRPHIIGLQEVSLLRTQCPDDIIFPPNDPTPNAQDVYADYLEVLLRALEVRGLHYEVAAMIENADVELPAANVPAVGPLADCPFPLFDARLTDFDVTLRRVDVPTSIIREQRYQFNLPVPTAAGEITFFRGYTIISAIVDGEAFAVINTHLEVDGNPAANLFQSLQAQELAQTLNALPSNLTQIVMGDFNSSPDLFTNDCISPVDPTVVIPDGCPSPYAILVGNGYADAWDLRRWRWGWLWADGFTCCQDPLLDNARSAHDRRIDQIWVREAMSGDGPSLTRNVFTSVFGTFRFNKTIDGLWPSDHAGVFSLMKFRTDDD